MSKQNGSNTRFVLNLVSLILFLVCLIITILTFTNVISQHYYIAISALVFILSVFVICFYDYSSGEIDKRRFIQQLVMYIIILLIVILYLLMTVFGG